MKRIICALLIIVMMLTVIPMAGASAEQAPMEQIVYYNDGSYLIINLEETENYSVSGTKAVQANSKSGNKTCTYYENTGVAVWAVTLSASFTYDGNSSSCTAANCSVNIYDSAWYVISKSTSRSGNTATANVTMGKKVLGVTTKTVPCTLTLSCDVNGNLS